MKIIMLFGFHSLADEMTIYRLREAMKQTKIELVSVKKEEYLMPLGKLAKMMPESLDIGKCTQSYEGEELPVRVLLFAGFSQEELEHTLMVCRQSGVQKEDLKAVLTPFNMLWNAVELCEELRKEHRQMHEKEDRKA